MKAAIYARYSSDSQREESIEDQVKACKKYAKRNKLEVVEIYEDKALTGTSDKRPNFQRMIQDSEASSWEYIICYKTDRFARSRADATKYKSILKANGVSVVYAEMTIPVGPEGIILEGVMEAIDEWYSANLSQNVKRGMNGNAEKAKTNGVTLFGYKTSKDGTYEIDEYQAQAVRKIFQMVLENMPDKEIVNWLNMSGYKNTYGRHFDKNAVARMTKNRKYMGEYKYDKIVIPHGMPAIIDEETFTRVQDIRAGRRSVRSRNRMCLLTGLIYCGECGESMNGTAGTSKTGKRYNYYTCNTVYKKIHCENKRFPQEKIENIILNLLTEKLFDEDVLDDLVDAILRYQKKNDNGNLARYESNLKDVDKKISNLTDAIAQGGYSKILFEKLGELEEERKNIMELINKENLTNKILNRDNLKLLIRKFAKKKDHSQEYNKRLIKTFVNKVFVYKDGHMVVTFNYKKNGTLATFETARVLEKSFGAPNNPYQELFNGVFIDEDNLYIILKI